jgi:hypothetical protein
LQQRAASNIRVPIGGFVEDFFYLNFAENVADYKLWIRRRVTQTKEKSAKMVYSGASFVIEHSGLYHGLKLRLVPAH